MPILPMHIPARRFAPIALMLVMQGASCRAAPEPAREITDHSETSPLDQRLEQGLSRYFRERERTQVHVEHHYLREGPTITGIAFPKYYLWVQVRDSDGSTLRTEGAVRVADLDSVVQITHFVPRDTMRSDPTVLDSIFPALVIQTMQSRF